MLDEATKLEVAGRPWWMTALAIFCAASVVVLVSRDLFLPRVREVEVWFGFEVRGPPALLTAPLHWVIFLVGAWGFWRQRPWILPCAAAYAFYVAFCHLVWNEVSRNGSGWLAGVAEAVAFSVPGVLLWRAWGRTVRGRLGPSGAFPIEAVNVPNLLSAFRIASVPFLLVLAWNGATGIFLLVFGLGLVSDVLDGVLARRLGQESQLGARLDQWGDFALWLCLPFGAWWLWPEIVRRESAYIILAIVAMVLPTAIGYAKYRAVPGYHTWSVKCGAVLMGVGGLLLLAFDLAWPFRIAALFQLVCAVDELGITLLLAEREHDVPSIFHALRLRRAKRQGTEEEI